MLGVQRVKEVALMVFENGRSTLSPGAVVALSTIFDQFCSEGPGEGQKGMTRADVVKYFRACGAVSASSTSAERLNSIFADYETDDLDRLTVGGLVGFYAHCGRYDPRAVWKDLSTHGWLRNLRHSDDMAAEEAASLQQPEALPPLSAAAIVSDDFMKAALNEDIATATSIFVRTGLTSDEAAATFAKALVSRIGAANYNVTGEAELKAAQASLERLFNMGSGFEQAALEAALSSEDGLLHFAASRACETHLNPNSTFAAKDVLRVIQVLMALYDRAGSPASEWLLSHMESWSWLVEWLRVATLLPGLGGSAVMKYRSPDKVRLLNRLAAAHDAPPCVVRGEAAAYLVSGAGTPEANGLYLRGGSHDRVPKYVHRAKVGMRTAQGQLVEQEILFTLFRCMLPSGSRYWYVSNADPVSPGTLKDKDYYSVKSNTQGPPFAGWVTCQYGSDPTPSVQRATADGEVEVEPDDVTLPTPLPPGFEAPVAPANDGYGFGVDDNLD